MGMIKAVLLLSFLMALADAGFASSKHFMPRAFQGEFVQIQKTKNPNKKNREIDTLISYQKPRNFRMYSKDSVGQDTLYICNKETTWFYSAPFTEDSKGQLKKGDSSKFCYVKIFDALNKGLTSNNIYTVKKLNERKYQLNFNPDAAKEVHFDRVELNFDDMPLNFKNIESLTMYSTSRKQPFVLKRKSVQIKNKLDSKLFTFKAPDNTDIEIMK